MSCHLCGSERVLTPTKDIGYMGCLDCRRIWEVLPDGQTWLAEGELMPWPEPCDNCAFRPGSPESADKPKWRELLGRLKKGGQFFCHKGVPIDWDMKTLEDPTASGVHGFNYPKDADGNEIPGEMRLCRGYLNVWSKWIEQEYGT